MEIVFAGQTDVGRTRSENQDAIYLPPPVEGDAPRLFVLADGMGGASGGQVASGLAMRVIPAAFLRALAGQGLEEALRGAVGEAAAAIHQAALDQPELKGMGTTVVALAVDSRRALAANVGDSRGYLWRAGQLSQITQDHSLVQRMVQEGSLQPDQARRHNLRNVLTRVVGIAPQVEVDLFEVSLAPGDVLLLCSDGLHGPVPEAEMARVLADPSPLADKARTLVDMANHRGGPDNISVVLVSVVDSGPSSKVGVATQRTRVPGAAPAMASPRGGRPAWFLWLGVLAAAAAAGAWLHLRPPASTSPVHIQPMPPPQQVVLEPIGPAPSSQTESPAEPPGAGQEPPDPIVQPQPAPTQPLPPAHKPAPAPEAKPATAARYTVCLGSFAEADQAEALAARVREAGPDLPPGRLEIEKRGGRWLVCAGDFANQTEAQKQAQAWKARGLSDSPSVTRRH